MKKKLLAFLLSLSMIAPLVVTTPAMATEIQNEESEGTEEKLSLDGYYLQWSDEFDEPVLNRDNWNVETHQPGWVNNELQEYVDSEDNLKIEDGKLVITPKETISEVKTDILSNADFSAGEGGLEGWTKVIGGNGAADITTSDGKVIFDISNTGNEDWNVQLKHSGVALEAGKSYRVTYDVTSTESRTIKSGVMSADCASWYGGVDPVLEAKSTKTVSFDFTMSTADETAAFYFSLGKVVADDPTTGKVEISNLKFVELSKTTILNSVSDLYVHSEGKSVLAKSVVDGKLVLEVTNFSDQPWHVQPQKADIDIETGYVYTVDLDVTSSIDKKYSAQIYNTTTYGWLTANSGESGTLSAGVKKHISIATDAIAADGVAGFSINLGNDNETLVSGTITIENINIVAVKEADPKSESSTTYTSARINTQNKQTFTYGYYEVSAKVPSGTGYLPAFWLMANDESIYGQWPQCGEIDCMEVLGDATNTVYGTIHYGNPNNQKQGLNEGEADLSADFHTYGCNWEPGKISWYIDGVKYYETSDWYTSNGSETISYPAPFDQPFYIILNLAVGGDWPGDPNADTFKQNNDFVIDYVRVYQKADYNEKVEKPESKFEPTREPVEGNYILSGSAYDTKYWEFKTNLGGEGSASTDAENGSIKIATTNQGTVDYSVQLLHAGIPAEKNKIYKVSFTAWADAARNIGVAVKAPNRNWAEYLQSTTVNLTTNKDATYEYEFTMTDESDDSARLEFNLGNCDSTETVYIKDVVYKVVGEVEPEPEPEFNPVRSDGNYIYNGSFEEGQYHLGNWSINKKFDSSYYEVTDFADGRRLHYVSTSDRENFALSQDKLDVNNSEDYLLSVDVESDRETQINVKVGDNDVTIEVAPGKKTYTKVISANSETELVSSHEFLMNITGKADIYIDNIKLTKFAMINDGDFANGNLGSYEIYKVTGNDASASVEDGKLVVNINDTADNDWDIQVKQNNLKIEKGNKYILKFKAKSTVNRQIRALIQGHIGNDYPVYSSIENNKDCVFDLTTEMKEYSLEFLMNNDTDPNAFLSICLGTYGGNHITDNHKVYFDDISLTVKKPVTIIDPYGNEYVRYVSVGGKLGEIIYYDDYTEYFSKPNGEGAKYSADYVVTEAMTLYQMCESDYNCVFVNYDYENEYTGMQIKPSVKVTIGYNELRENIDYKITYKNNINVVPDDTAEDKWPSFTVTFIGNYAGTEAYTDYFLIYSKSITGSDVSVADVQVKYNYTGKVVKPVPAVTVNGKKLAAAKLTYSYYGVDSEGTLGEEVVPKEPGEYAVVVRGKNGYTDAVRKDFTILDKEQKLISTLKVVAGKKNVAYTGEEITDLASAFGITVSNGTKKLTAGEDYEVSTADSTVEVGTLTLTITGKEAKGYFGKTTVKVAIIGTPITKARVAGIVTKAEYTGEAIIQNAVLTYAGKSLTGVLVEEYNAAEDKSDYDYTIAYTNNVQCGTATVTFTGVNGYTGSVKKTFKITGTSIARAKVEGLASTVSYTGSAVTQNLKVSLGTEPIKLVNKQTYNMVSDTVKKNFNAVVEYKNNTKAGKATITITGINGYEGTITKVFTIKPYDIAKNTEKRFTAKLSSNTYEHSKAGTKPVPVVKFNGKVLTQNVDYVVSYINNTKLCDNLTATRVPTVKITGRGNFAGTNASCQFLIGPAMLQSVATATANDIKYVNKNNNYKSNIKVVDENGKALILNRDYKITGYSVNGNTVEDGYKLAQEGFTTAKVTATITGMGNYAEDTINCSYNVYATDISQYTFAVKEAKEYTGKAVTIEKNDITITYKGKAVENADEILNNITIDKASYQKNINAGTASVTIKGEGKYGGTKKVTFKIVGKKATVGAFD